MQAEISRYDTVELSGVKVRLHRRRLRLTQQQVADAIQRSRGWISVIESSERPRVSRQTAHQLTLALQTSLPELQPPAAAPGAEPAELAADQPLLPAGSADREEMELHAVLADLKRLERIIARLIAARADRREMGEPTGG